MEILRSSGNKSRSRPSEKGETDFLYCPSAPTTARTAARLKRPRGGLETVFETRRKTIYSGRRAFLFLEPSRFHESRDSRLARSPTIALKAEIASITQSLRKEGGAARADHFFLPHFVFLNFIIIFFLFFFFTSFTSRSRRRRGLVVVVTRLLPRGTSASQGTDASNITSSGPFYGYCYAPLLHRISTLRICVNYYTRAVYIRAAYIRITSRLDRARPYYYLPV